MLLFICIGFIFWVERVGSTAQTQAIAEITNGRCNVSRDEDLCTACASVVTNCVLANDSFTFMLDYAYFALTLLPRSIGALTGLRELVVDRRISGTLPTELGRMRSLRALYLNNCSIGGTIPTELGLLGPSLEIFEVTTEDSQIFTRLEGTIPTELGLLSKLTSLNLNLQLMLTGTIPTQLFNARALQSLKISNRFMAATLPTHVGQLTALVELELMLTMKGGTLPTELGLCRNLVNLNFDAQRAIQNGLSGTLPTELGNLNKLQSLHVEDNVFSGPIPTEIGNMNSLYYINLQSNDFSGAIPDQFWELPNLRHVLLTNNKKLGGTIPSTIGQGLWRVKLSNNAFSGILPREMFANTSIQYLDISRNYFSGTIPTEIGRLKDLSYIRLLYNYFSGTLPEELGNLRELTVIDISHNRFEGTIPSSLVKLELLADFQAQFNNFTGPLPSEFGRIPKLKTLMLTYNGITSLPNELFQLPGLTDLHVDANQLKEIPADIGLATTLKILKLAKNQISGTIPSQLANLTGLVRLDLSNNLLEGTIPSELTRNCSKGLTYLRLDRNRLNGTIPSDIGNCFLLTTLTLDLNGFTGPLPTSFANCQYLKELRLSFNALNGVIPAIIFSERINILDLSFNQFTAIEPLPQSRNCYLQYLTLNNNRILGAFPASILNCPALTDLVISSNNFTGPFPAIHDHDSIEVLELSGNGFTSCELSELPLLRSLELQDNQIESVNLSSLPNLTYIDLNYNGLTDLPSFLFEPGLGSDWNIDLSIYLKTNKINTSIPVNALWNPAIRNLDISLNKITGKADFLFYTPSERMSIDYNSRKCVKDSELPNPSDRLILLFQNRMETVYYNVTEIFLFPGRRWFDDVCRYNEGSDPSQSDYVKFENKTSRFSALPQEFDRCNRSDTHNCSHYCFDGWNPPLSYTCRCNFSYYLESDRTSCASCYILPWRVEEAAAGFIFTWGNFMQRWMNSSRLPDYLGFGCSHCDINTGTRRKSVGLQPYPECVRVQPYELQACEYPCRKSDGNFALSPFQELVYYQQQFSKANFLAFLLHHAFELELVSMNVTQERHWLRDLFKSVFILSAKLKSPCNAPDNLPPMMAQLVELIGIENQLDEIRFSNCEIAIQLSSTIPPLVPIILSVIAVVLIIAITSSLVIYFYYFKSTLHQLPPIVSWSLWKYKLSPWKWEFESKFESDRGFYYTKFEKESTDWNKVINLFNEYLDGTRFQVQSIAAIYNPALTASFISNYSKMKTRYLDHPGLFHSQSYRTRVEERKLVREQYLKLISSFEKWFDKAEYALPLVPVVHATGWEVSLYIAQTGFCNLSTYDAGYYGKGIYFTSSAFYTVRYMQQKPGPTMIISWIIPGNIYPVVEHYKGSDSILGKPIKSGYQSHYIITNIVGDPISPSAQGIECYNEFAIDQENQILPVFLLTFNAANFNSVAKSYMEAMTTCAMDALPQQHNNAGQLVSESSDSESAVNKRRTQSLRVELEEDREETNSDPRNEQYYARRLESDVELESLI